jgi:hypothetical protein
LGAVRNVIELVSRSGCAWEEIAVARTECEGGCCPHAGRTLIPNRKKMNMMTFMRDQTLKFSQLDEGGSALVEVN